ncbi:hypothetical protein WJX82_002349 [Trebouxia sp. C0006]
MCSLGNKRANLLAPQKGKDPVNFDIEDFDPVKICASASTLDEFVAGMRKHKGPRSSRFKGVFEAQGGKYLARLTLHGKPKHLGTYLDAEEAAKAVDAANIFLGQDPVNFDVVDFGPVEICASASSIDEFIAGVKRHQVKRHQENAESSQFVNVVKKPDVNKFRAYIVLQHKQVHLGYFPAKEQAARAVDVAKLYMDTGMLNFPKEEYNLSDIKASASTFDDLVAALRLEARHAASGRVAAYRPRVGKIDGNMTFGSRRGSDRALIFLGEKPTSLPQSQYNAEELYQQIQTSTTIFAEFARGERQRAETALREDGWMHTSLRKFLIYTLNGRQNEYWPYLSP